MITKGTLHNRLTGELIGEVTDIHLVWKPSDVNRSYFQSIRHDLKQEVITCTITCPLSEEEHRALQRNLDRMLYQNTVGQALAAERDKPITPIYPERLPINIVRSKP